VEMEMKLEGTREIVRSAERTKHQRSTHELLLLAV
jgi:hypothetical protein